MSYCYFSFPFSSLISLCFPCLHQFSARRTASGWIKAAGYLGLLCFPSVTSETWTSQAFLDPLPLSFPLIPSLTDHCQSPGHSQGGWYLYQRDPLPVWALLGKKSVLCLYVKIWSKSHWSQMSTFYSVFSNACSMTNHPVTNRPHRKQDSTARETKVLKNIFSLSPLFPWQVSL